MIRDAHVHIWVNDPEKYPWNPIGGYIPQNEAPIEMLAQLMDKSGVQGAVLVQPTPYGWDNSYMLDAAGGKEDRFRCVVLVNPLAEHASLDLATLKQKGAKGVRINLHLIPPAACDNQAFLGLWQTIHDLNLPVCLQLTPLYFYIVEQLAKKYPHTKIILDHLARPDKGSDLTNQNFNDLLGLAIHPNIYVKLSGLNYYSTKKAPYKDTWRLLKAINKQYSPQRCLWGSDFPFVEEHWSYEQNLKTYQREMEFTAMDLEWILGKTADSIWWSE